MIQIRLESKMAESTKSLGFDLKIDSEYQNIVNMFDVTMYTNST